MRGHAAALVGAGGRDVRSTANGDVITATVSVSAAEAALQAAFHEYEHDALGRHVRTTRYTLPAHVAAHVDVVGPTVRFPASSLAHTRLEQRAPSAAARARRLRAGDSSGIVDRRLLALAEL